jgi:hypothetical protein
MIKTATILSSVAILCTVAGCGQPFTGAAFGSSIVGNKALVYACGYVEDEKLAYVVFTDLDGMQTTSSVSGSWSGWFKDKRHGSTIRYKATATGIDIDGVSHDFSAGRVFLLSTAGGTTSINQLSIPFSGAAYEAEIKTLESQSDVMKFRETAGTR